MLGKCVRSPERRLMIFKFLFLFLGNYLVLLSEHELLLNFKLFMYAYDIFIIINIFLNFFCDVVELTIHHPSIKKPSVHYPISSRVSVGVRRSSFHRSTGKSEVHPGQLTRPSQAHIQRRTTTTTVHAHIHSMVNLDCPST